MNSESNFRVFIRCRACFILAAFLLAGCATATTKDLPSQGTVVAKFTLEVPQDPAGVERTMSILTQRATKKMEELGCYGCNLTMVGMTMETYYPSGSQGPQEKLVGTFEVRR